jgi:hypothetical protein
VGISVFLVICKISHSLSRDLHLVFNISLAPFLAFPYPSHYTSQQLCTSG